MVLCTTIKLNNGNRLLKWANTSLLQNHNRYFLMNEDTLLT